MTPQKGQRANLNGSSVNEIWPTYPRRLEEGEDCQPGSGLGAGTDKQGGVGLIRRNCSG